MVNIGDKIRNIRELKNLTQEYMASQLGMTQAGYSKIESGTSQVNYSKLNEIAKTLNVNVEDILAFDSQKYFNSFNNVKGNNNGSVTIHVEDNKMKKLYEDKIELLQKLLTKTEHELNEYKNRFGDI